MSLSFQGVVTLQSNTEDSRPSDDDVNYLSNRRLGHCTDPFP
jgi:hypothetical protein